MVNNDISNAIARVEAARIAEKNAQHDLLYTTTWSAINDKKRALADAESELENAQDALSALQRTSKVMNSFALAAGLAEAGSAFLDNAFSTGINYGPSLYTAQSMQRAAQAGLFGLSALDDL